MNEITLDDLKSYQEDMVAEEKEAAKRAEKNECVCGTAVSYTHLTLPTIE